MKTSSFSFIAAGLLFVILSRGNIAIANTPTFYSVQVTSDLTTQFMQNDGSPIYGYGEGKGTAILHNDTLHLNITMKMPMYCWLESIDLCDTNIVLDDYHLSSHAVIHLDEQPSYAGIQGCLSTGSAPDICHQLTENRAFVVDVERSGTGRDISLLHELTLTIPADPFYLTMNYTLTEVDASSDYLLVH